MRGIRDRQHRALRAAWLRALLPACALLLCAGCTARSYAGIPLLAGQADPALQSLAQRAASGDKQAQLDLGIRFEEGNGVPRDAGRAIKLYRQAASDTGGTIWVYTPSPGNGAPGRVIPVDTGPRQMGLVEAKRRLVRNGQWADE